MDQDRSPVGTPESAQSSRQSMSSVFASIAADVRNIWRHPRRSAVSLALHVAWVVIVDVVICFGLGDLWFRCWYSPADLSDDRLGFAWRGPPGDPSALWDDSQGFRHRNNFRAAQMQWFWWNCPVCLVGCTVMCYLGDKIWPRLQARLYRSKHHLMNTLRAILFGPPEYLFRLLYGPSYRLPSTGTLASVGGAVHRNPRRQRLCCWLRTAIPYVIGIVCGFRFQSVPQSIYATAGIILPDRWEIARKSQQGPSSIASVGPSPGSILSAAEPDPVTERDPPPAATRRPHKTDHVTLTEQTRTLQWANDGLKKQLKELADESALVKDTLKDTLIECQRNKENGDFHRSDLEKVIEIWLASNKERHARNVKLIDRGEEPTLQDDLVASNFRLELESVLYGALDRDTNLRKQYPNVRPSEPPPWAVIIPRVTAERNELYRTRKTLLVHVDRLRRALFASRRRPWTVAIIRALGDSFADQQPEPSALTDFFLREKGDGIHLVCGAVAGIPASPSSTSSKGCVMDDVFIAESNANIGASLTQLACRAYWENNVCFIADGQSGSGKSYFLFNGPDALAPAIGKEIWNAERRHESTVECTALEVYQDEARDLLCPKGSPQTGPLKFKFRGGNQEVVGARSEPIESEEQLRTLFTQICRKRHVSATGENAVSSRGHMMCTLTIRSASRETRVVIVDLAGSERRHGESLEGDQRKENHDINKSRSNIRRALVSFASNTPPNKDCAMTKALSSILGPNSKVIMLAHLSPFAKDYSRSLDTLHFATEVSGTELYPLSPEEVVQIKREDSQPVFFPRD